jgi:hypothetical protein
MTEYTEIKVEFIFSNGRAYIHTFESLNNKTPQQTWDTFRETLANSTNIHTSDGVFINMQQVCMMLWMNRPDK